MLTRIVPLASGFQLNHKEGEAAPSYCKLRRMIWIIKFCPDSLMLALRPNCEQKPAPRKRTEI
jgi:hypothetical protein